MVVVIDRAVFFSDVVCLPSLWAVKSSNRSILLSRTPLDILWLASVEAAVRKSSGSMVSSMYVKASWWRSMVEWMAAICFQWLAFSTAKVMGTAAANPAAMEMAIIVMIPTALFLRAGH